MASNKIKNDKYYTSPKLAKYCVDKTKEIIGKDNITEWLEPSGGNGVFLDYLPDGTYSCDIEPEDDRIVKQDYLELKMDYKKGRCVIGNPPFGVRNRLSYRFFKKSIRLCDYIAFILPISQLNNNIQYYDFDMIYSEDLGKQNYSDREVHCCLNIYKMPLKNILNNKPNFKLLDVMIKESMRNNHNLNARRQIVEYKDFKYDIRICAFGSSIGKEVKYEEQYVNEFSIKINNIKYRDNILKILKNVQWKNIYSMTKTPNLTQWQVYKYLKEQIPELE